MDMDHPDLIEVGHKLRTRMEAVLDAEREAAAVAARRAANLRSVLIDAEDEHREVLVWIEGSTELHGFLRAVGTDHIEIVDTHGTSLIAVASIRAIRLL